MPESNVFYALPYTFNLILNLSCICIQRVHLKTLVHMYLPIIKVCPEKKFTPKNNDHVTNFFCVRHLGI